MQVYYDKDADLDIIKNKKVVIVGYGSQGHAHANNLKDSGGYVTVALRKESASWSKAEAAGLDVQEVAEAVKDADMVMILMPDELQSATYKSEIENNNNKMPVPSEKEVLKEVLNDVKKNNAEANANVETENNNG